MLNIIRGKCEKIEIAKALEGILKEKVTEGTLYFGYPIINTVDGPIYIDASLITKKHGLIIFDLCEERISESREELQDNIYNKVESKLKQYSSLSKGRKLKVQMEVITFCPNIDKNYENDFTAKNDTELSNILDNLNWSDQEYYSKLNSSIQAVTRIKTNLQRKNLKIANSRGNKIKKLEESISNLDKFQNTAVIETTNGPQRIRGLAGSGKTIVLALKVAYLHSQYPDWKIAITFNTRSLKEQFIDLIERFTYEHINDRPNWKNIKIIHAWGSSKVDGIYYQVCKEHQINYLDYGQAKEMYSNGREFEGVCKKALSEINSFKELYDVILIDEAQDFSDHFLKICYSILKKPKRLIWAYDELQTLNKTSMKSPEEIFGYDTEGNPLVSLKNEIGKAKEDIILEKCYRNSRPLLSTAHAFGFGIYNENELVQMFDDSQLWREIGYEKESGEFESGQSITLKRTENTSPLFLESHSEIDDIIKCKSFSSNEEQITWIANEINKNLKEDELEYKDIMVIHTNPIKTQRLVGELRNLLFKQNINSHLVGVTSSKDGFFEEDSIAFTGIYRAKGNEAPMVYIMDSQECYSGLELIKKRNILFTAITRSKAWVRITGYGKKMDNLVSEYNAIKDHDFKLSFKYPTLEEMEKLKVIHRDRTRFEKLEIVKQNKVLKQLASSIAGGVISIDDLDPEVLKILRGSESHD